MDSADWPVEPKWSLCAALGEDDCNVNSVGALLDGGNKVLVCNQAIFRIAVDKFGVNKFDGRLIAVYELLYRRHFGSYEGDKCFTGWRRRRGIYNP